MCRVDHTQRVSASGQRREGVLTGVGDETPTSPCTAGTGTADTQACTHSRDSDLDSYFLHQSTLVLSVDAASNGRQEREAPRKRLPHSHAVQNESSTPQGPLRRLRPERPPRPAAPPPAPASRDVEEQVGTDLFPNAQPTDVGPPPQRRVRKRRESLLQLAVRRRRAMRRGAAGCVVALMGVGGHAPLLLSRPIVEVIPFQLFSTWVNGQPSQHFSEQPGRNPPHT